MFALTGFGNEVLRSLVANNVIPCVLVTRKEKGAYPYYDETDLSWEAQKYSTPVLFGEQGENFVSTNYFDIILVCTYHRLLRPIVYQPSKLAINIHPSLLPAYRGASPIYWVIRNGESKTGLTAHILTEKMDDGDIILQDALPISPTETQGTLRKKLAVMAGQFTIRLLKLVDQGTLNPIPQDASKASYYPKVDARVRSIDPAWSEDQIERHSRALFPFPGPLSNG